MRMTPPGGSPLLREVPSSGIMIDGHYFPAGTDVGVPSYAIHHKSSYFPDPFTYNPSRWIANSEAGVTEPDLALAHSAFCPFSLGSRGCAGKGLAYVEMMMVIGRMVWLFDFRLAEGSTLGEGNESLAEGRKRTNEFQTRENITSSHDGPLVEFRPRIVKA